MTTPARDAAPAEHEQGIGSRLAGTERSQSAVAVRAAAIARLRQSVRAWIDGDRILPADGSCLLATLDQALVGLTEAHAPAARAEIEQFVRQVQVLTEARVLEAGDGHRSVEAATLLLAALSRAGATDAATDR